MGKFQSIKKAVPRCFVEMPRVVGVWLPVTLNMNMRRRNAAAAAQPPSPAAVPYSGAFTSRSRYAAQISLLLGSTRTVEVSIPTKSPARAAGVRTDACTPSTLVRRIVEIAEDWQGIIHCRFARGVSASIATGLRACGMPASSIRTCRTARQAKYRSSIIW